jgi:hypothetical protein
LGHSSIGIIEQRETAFQLNKWHVLVSVLLMMVN